MSCRKGRKMNEVWCETGESGSSGGHLFSWFLNFNVFSTKTHTATSVMITIIISNKNNKKKQITGFF